ncbi:MAG: insulinase family protein, partial [Candidatus Eremiobacteraeota bacterium]|nr:insulinase family protein [Candidatus Eremiobacteraeota bacterium]
TNYAQRGVPPELFATTKRQLIAAQELSRNSISALASDWATTIALDGEPSIAREQQLIAAVTLGEVNRGAHHYLDVDHAGIGALTPAAGASVNAPPAPAQQGPEKPLGAQPPVTVLPEWGNALLANVTVPAAARQPAQTKLPNGINLIVEPETISDSVFVFGRVRTTPGLQEPAGKEGVSSVLAALFGQGTQTRDRIAFARAQDDIDSTVAAGYDFALQTTSPDVDRAIALLAENELHPRFDEPTFAFAQRRAVDELRTAQNGSATVAQRRAETKLLPAGDPQLREPTVNGLEQLTLDDAKAYDRAVMRPDLTTIVVVGNITVPAARAAIERSFGGWQATGPAPALELPAVPVNPPAEVRLTLPAGGQDDVSLLQIVPLARSAPELSPLELGNAILGGGALGPDQSRLFRDLRQNAGLVYSIGSRLSSSGTRSRFTTTFACLPANEPHIASLIDAEIERMKTEPVGSFELSLMKASLVHRSLIGDAAVESIGQALLDAAADGLPLDVARIDNERIVASDAASVQHAFAEYLHPKDFVRVIVGP